MAEAGGIAGDRLRQLIDKIERLEDERREVGDQVKEVMAEAKGEGFDIKVLRQILKLRRMKPHDRTEQEELLELYKAAIGMA
jgi:uncharacterized protein (UPF0335 family)